MAVKHIFSACFAAGAGTHFAIGAVERIRIREFDAGWYLFLSG
jgi:hypothetical protein